MLRAHALAGNFLQKYVKVDENKLTKVMVFVKHTVSFVNKIKGREKRIGGREGWGKNGLTLHGKWERRCNIGWNVGTT